MAFNGVFIGIMAFAIIGFFHPIIIKVEYYFTDKVWPVFLIVGIAAVVLSCFIKQTLVSAFLGIFGCTALWSIHELKQQTARVAKGWFPKNPKRTAATGGDRL
ncbi:MAG: DUF4491 family protein [Clostridiales bacterium]|nr:DUF4491 family protein [Clostridiales bacterium]